MEERHLVHKSEVIAAAACTQRHLGWPMGHADISRDAETKKKNNQMKTYKKKNNNKSPIWKHHPRNRQPNFYLSACKSKRGGDAAVRAGSSEHIIEPCTQPGMGASPGLAQAMAHWNTGTQSVAKRKDFPMEPSGRKGNSRKMSPMQTFPFSYVLILHATEAEIKLRDINTRTDP